MRSRSGILNSLLDIRCEDFYGSLVGNSTGRLVDRFRKDTVRQIVADRQGEMVRACTTDDAIVMAWFCCLQMFDAILRHSHCHATRADRLIAWCNPVSLESGSEMGPGANPNKSAAVVKTSVGLQHRTAQRTNGCRSLAHTALHGAASPQHSSAAFTVQCHVCRSVSTAQYHTHAVSPMAHSRQQLITPSARNIPCEISHTVQLSIMSPNWPTCKPHDNQRCKPHDTQRDHSGVCCVCIVTYVICAA